MPLESRLHRRQTKASRERRWRVEKKLITTIKVSSEIQRVLPFSSPYSAVLLPPSSNNFPFSFSPSTRIRTFALIDAFKVLLFPVSLTPSACFLLDPIAACRYLWKF